MSLDAKSDGLRAQSLAHEPLRALPQEYSALSAFLCHLCYLASVGLERQDQSFDQHLMLIIILVMMSLSTSFEC